MKFFTPDLYRQLGLGFLIGAAMLALVNADALVTQMSPPAQAAQTLQAPQPASEFRIKPLG